MVSSLVDSAYITATNERPENRHRRAGITPPAFERVRDAAPDGVEVVAIDDGLDLGTVDFLVPSSFEERVMEALPGSRR
jgi:hypothetical protein